MYLHSTRHRTRQNDRERLPCVTYWLPNNNSFILKFLKYELWLFIFLKKKTKVPTILYFIVSLFCSKQYYCTIHPMITVMWLQATPLRYVYRYIYRYRFKKYMLRLRMFLYYYLNQYKLDINKYKPRNFLIFIFGYLQWCLF